MPEGLKVSVRETREAKEAIRKLHVMKVTPEMRREMMRATAPAIPALRSAIRQIPSKNEDTHAPPGLREALTK